MHELNYYDKACFITLTYDNEHLPKNYTLVPKHLQNFFKLLRYYAHKQNREIKYFGVGEYGEENHRPHYHAIIFGIDMTEVQTTHGSMIKNGIIKQAWKEQGLIHIGTVTHDSCQYVTGYIMKKQTGKNGKEYYEKTKREPPFKLSSQGLGLRFAIAEKHNIVANNFIPFNKEKKPIPVYYRKKLDLDITELIKIATENSNKVLEHHMKNSGTETLHIIDLEKYNELKNSKLPYWMKGELDHMDQLMIENQKFEESKRKSREQIKNYLEEQERRSKVRQGHEN